MKNQIRKLIRVKWKKIHQAVSIPLTPAMPNGAKTHHVPISGHGNLNIKLNPKLYKRFDVNFNFRQKIQQICIFPSLGINGLRSTHIILRIRYACTQYPYLQQRALWRLLYSKDIHHLWDIRHKIKRHKFLIYGKTKKVAKHKVRWIRWIPTIKL